MLNNLFNSVLSLAVDSSYLIIAVLIARFALRKSTKAYRKVLWALVGVRLAVPFSFHSKLSLLPRKFSEVNSEIPVVGTNIISETASTTEKLGFLDVAPYIWLSIFILILGYGIYSYIKLRLKISDSVLYKDNIYQSDKIDSPFVCGFVKPKIYIPYNLNEDVLDCVLKHERAHIKNLDHIIKGVSFLILSFYWFNPLVWASYLLLFKDIELACDESVIKNMDSEDRRKYASALCDMGIEKFRVTACPVAFGETGIKERILSTVHYKKVNSLVLVASAVVCVLLTVCFMTEPENAKLAPSKKLGKEEAVTVNVQENADLEANNNLEPTEPLSEPTTEETEAFTEGEKYTEPYSENNAPTISAEIKNKIESERASLTIPKSPYEEDLESIDVFGNEHHGEASNSNSDDNILDLPEINLFPDIP